MRALVGDDRPRPASAPASGSRPPRRRARSRRRWCPCCAPGCRRPRSAISASIGSLCLTTSLSSGSVTWRVSAPMRSLPPVVVDVVELLDAVDVDQRRRLRQAQPHQRDQAVAAGEHLGVLAVLAEQLRRLLDRGGASRIRMRLGSLASPSLPSGFALRPGSASRAGPGWPACRRA